MSSEQVLRALIVKQLNGFSYEELSTAMLFDERPGNGEHGF